MARRGGAAAAPCFGRATAQATGRPDPIPPWDEALFIGWFGPMGVGALYFAAVAEKETGLPHVWSVTTLLVAISIVVHDVTATPLSIWLAGRRRLDPDGP
ncbi:MAG: hypothetical protein M3R24_05915 [Chloroflexota bacterium]|nr:hypothetical protein [Chloroflexota bacterium]